MGQSVNRIETGLIGIVTRLRAKCGPDEKVVIDRTSNMACIVPKRKVDYLLERLFKMEER